MKEGSVDNREHSYFLNMWLEHFIFYGKVVGPAIHYQWLAEHLAQGKNFALGKHLLGLVYSLLHKVSIRLRTKQQIKNLGGPWSSLICGWTCICKKCWMIPWSVKCFQPIKLKKEMQTSSNACPLATQLRAFPGDRHPSTRTIEYFRSFYNGLKEDSKSPGTRYLSTFRVPVSVIPVEERGSMRYVLGSRSGTCSGNIDSPRRSSDPSNRTSGWPFMLYY